MIEAHQLCKQFGGFHAVRNLSLEIPEKVISSHREHLAIVEALQEGDGERAQALIHTHFEHAAEYLLQGLMRPRSTDGARPDVILDVHR